MTIEQFETLLDNVAAQLTQESKQNPFQTSKAFEIRVRQIIEQLGSGFGVKVNYDPHPFAFPDIALGEFGVEVKFTTGDTWRSIANSVFESFRSEEVIYVYVMFGKMGGEPEVRWARYDECVMHVRTTHVPRFELDIDARSSLFDEMKISYDDFRILSLEEKMQYIRRYAKSRLKKGERLWWLEDKDEPEHSLPLEVRLYTQLEDNEKRQLRAEATLLCPKIVGGSRIRDKYNDVVFYLSTYRGVIASNVRDLFTAGSVAGNAGGEPTKDKNSYDHIKRALRDIETEMIEAAHRLEDDLFIEYWGEAVAPENRIDEWLRRADEYAGDWWTPSEELFLSRRR